ncbi:MAG: molybdenum ABC transporter ATP-binding protein [Chloroflexi bacterium]|nr:molybdenum ABC transporter ATP-binding protein [Chloroflexota bacterium]
MKPVNWRLQLQYALPPFHLEMDIDVESTVLAVFGPSGAGKSTLLELLCGLRKPHHGTIRVGDRVLFDSSRKLNVPSRSRHIGWVPQDASLFPHLSVRDNIFYGAGRGPAKCDVTAVIEVLNLSHTLGRSASSLSGGEKQRVALARALASCPDILLLDEPLGSLDIPLRYKIFPYLLKIRDVFGIPTLYVSHDPNEVMSIADYVVMLVAGKVVNQGNPAALLAGLRGLSLDGNDMSLNTLKVKRLELLPSEGIERVVTETGLTLTIPLNPIRTDLAGFVTVSAHDIILFREAPGGISAPNVFRGSITGIVTVGPHAYIHTSAGLVAGISRTSASQLGLSHGDTVYLAIAAEHCHWMTTLPSRDPFNES